MIVKNEQDWIAGAVESVRSIIDEVIIVDTGSTDATPERIQALGVKSFKPDKALKVLGNLTEADATVVPDRRRTFATKQPR